MSSKALATALLSYGADLKIKNILLEIFFSVLPPTMMSEYQLFDHTDELVVDLLFQYVKSILRERGEYYGVCQGLMLETYPDIELHDLKPNQISLLADFAVKRLVYKAVEKINNKIYVDPPDDVSKFDDIGKKRFILSLTEKNDSSVSQMIRLENTGKLSFLNSTGKIRSIPSVENHNYMGKSDVKFCRVTSGAEKIPVIPSPPETPKWKVPVKGKAPPVVHTTYQNPVYCFEPYIRVQTTGFDAGGNTEQALDDLQLCVKDITDEYDPKKLAKILGAFSEMVVLFSTGTEYVALPSDSPFDSASLENLKQIVGKEFVCSIDDLDAYWTNTLAPALWLNSSSVKGVQPSLMNAVFSGIFLGVRCSVDTAGTDPVFADPPQQDVANMDALRAKGFIEKTFYYLEPFDKDNGTLNTAPAHFTAVLASKEQKFEFAKIATVLDMGKEFNDLRISQVLYDPSASGYQPPSEISTGVTGATPGVPSGTANARGLMTELLKTKEFDALIKSVFVPAMLYNTISLIPNIEIGQDLVPMMRQRGVFSGLDEVLNGMFFQLQSYLTGEFPWGTADCGDLSKLL